MKMILLALKFQSKVEIFRKGSMSRVYSVLFIGGLTKQERIKQDSCDGSNSWTGQDKLVYLRSGGIRTKLEISPVEVVHP